MFIYLCVLITFIFYLMFFNNNPNELFKCLFSFIHKNDTTYVNLPHADEKHAQSAIQEICHTAK